MSTTPKQYSYSFDEERYTGSYSDPMQAAWEAFNDEPDAESVFIGENIPPTPPENFIDADLIIEHVQQQDEYEEEWAESWPGATKKEAEELTGMMQAAFAAWMDKNNRRPKFFTVENVRRITKAEAEAATK